MNKNISILGSTGSIGVQALQVAKNLGIRVSALTANSSIEVLKEQMLEFKPDLVSVGTPELARRLEALTGDTETEIRYGMDGMIAAATMEGVDTVLTSVVGIAGLIPTVEAIRKGKNIALANKETLVTAGDIVMSLASTHGVHILPVDSEHSAIFQCLMGNNRRDVSKIILTASGGPFRGKTPEFLEGVTLKDALNHPNWKMGAKITIDSSTLMNKGLEVIEAKWLFGMEPSEIQVLVHPQSIIHSMVEYQDGSVMAQLGSPDMRLPIQLALTYPGRASNEFSRLDLLKTGPLTFEEPDFNTFPCLRLAFEALQEGGTMPAVLNGANEIAVELFLKEKIRFASIPGIIEGVMQKHVKHSAPTLDDIIEGDRWARETALRLAKEI